MKKYRITIEVELDNDVNRTMELERMMNYPLRKDMNLEFGSWLYNYEYKVESL